MIHRHGHPNLPPGVTLDDLERHAMGECFRCVNVGTCDADLDHDSAGLMKCGGPFDVGDWVNLAEDFYMEDRNDDSGR